MTELKTMTKSKSAKSAEKIVAFLNSELKSGKTVVVVSDKKLKEFGVKTKLPAWSVKRWKMWEKVGWSVRTWKGDNAVFTRIAESPYSPEKPSASASKVETPAVKKVAKKSNRFKSWFAFPPETPIIDHSLSNNKPLFLTGPTGCGKTEMIMRLLDKESREFVRLNLRRDMSSEDFIGNYELINGETVWVDGFLPKCMKEGVPMIFDEIDYALPEILTVIQAVLEGNEFVNTKNGEIVSPSNGFNIIATGNTKGRGDMSSLYSGTTPLNESFLDRFNYFLELGYPSERIEAKIINKRTGLVMSECEKISDLASRVRTAFNEGHVLSTFSVRKSLNLGVAIKDFDDIEIALRCTILDRVSEEDSSIIKEAVQRIWGVS